MAIALGSVAPTIASAQTAAPGFARIFTDHAVLQRDRPIPVWGHAAPGAAVTVSLAGQSVSAKADRQGIWHVTLPKQPAGRAYRLSVASNGGTTTLEDIAVGDVFLCGGQSNMEFPTRLSTGAWGSLNGAANPDLRFVTIAQDSEPAPQADLKTAVTWKVVTPDTVGESSAVCYYMARSLQQRYKIPIGFIASDWGGTTIQSWISPQALGSLPAYRKGVDAVALLASNPRQAQADDAKRVETWWDANDPQAGAQRAWVAPDYDDDAWPSMISHGSWKDSGVPALTAFDGVVWFRTTVTLTDAQARSGASLQLGPIDTYDTAWINGVRVGGGTVAWVWRNYPIPAGTLKPGRNVIVLRVLGGKNGGGLTGRPEARGIKLASDEIVLLGQSWRYRTGGRVTGPPIAPSPWDVPVSLTTLYNGMIAPVAGYGIKLAAWYQGEANADAPKEYATLLPLLMADWRKRFDQPELPFLIAQLSSFGAASATPVESGWPALRDVQGKVARDDPHAGLAVTIDIGDRTDIHPTQKTVVGERLARAARALAYGEAITPGGPEAMTVERRGTDLVVHFRHVTGGLHSYSADVAIGFEACDAAHCRFVAGKPEGDAIILPGANTPGVARVRYAWADSSYVNLYDGDDLPAVPFELSIGQ
ncbi:MAG TPA: sialate O-acetylesterase [Sphingomonas sp.]